MHLGATQVLQRQKADLSAQIMVEFCIQIGCRTIAHLVAQKVKVKVHAEAAAAWSDTSQTEAQIQRSQRTH